LNILAWTFTEIVFLYNSEEGYLIYYTAGYVVITNWITYDIVYFHVRLEKSLGREEDRDIDTFESEMMKMSIHDAGKAAKNQYELLNDMSNR
jgi:hypothetical protein